MAPVEVNNILAAKVKIISTKYGERVKLTAGEVAEIVKDIKKGFLHYGKDEIEEAFYLWSTGKIGDASTELYGGKINALVVNRILTYYESWRKTEIEKYLIEQRNIKFMEEEKKRHAEGLKKLNTMADSEVLKLVRTYERYDEIPIYLVNQIIDRKLVRKLSEAEKEKYVKEGKQLHKLAIERDKLALKGTPGQIKDGVRKIEEHYKNSEKITIFRNIIFCELCLKS